ncbi:DNA-deoxyinosine glycosylase [Allocoprobacillus halotolerans]|uniref:DNA-deoxyinosine glycosylase n=1 Tax=Allocoprobacillus halotolerans TaxID=2944914 RepID=UPI00338F7DD6
MLYHHQSLNSIEEKKAFLLANHIALWDVIESCDIQGSSDSSIQNVQVNDLNSLLKQTKITHIYTNGKKAHQLYMKYCYPMTRIKDYCLPSTSPANAAYSLEQLLKEWQKICHEFIESS